MLKQLGVNGRFWKTVIVQKYPRNFIITLWGLINLYHTEYFLNLLKLACLAISFPVDAEGCERGFSIKTILTTLRNRLNTDTKNQLMRIRMMKHVKNLSLTQFWEFGSPKPKRKSSQYPVTLHQTSLIGQFYMFLCTTDYANSTDLEYPCFYTMMHCPMN